MQTRQLGFSELQLTTVGFGAWAIGGAGWQYSWGEQDDAESIASIRHAVDCGVNWIDTAAVYGDGHSEAVVGRALEGLAKKPIVATKCGRKLNAAGAPYGDLAPDSVRAECEASLTRLKVDVIDLYQVHWPDPDAQIEGAMEVLAKLVEEGKVRYVGVSNFNVDQMKRAQKIQPLASLQPPYSMLKRDIESEILPFCKEERIGVVCYSPMQCGLLTGAFDRVRMQTLAADDWRHRNPYFQEPSFSATMDLVDGLKTIAKRLDAATPHIALAWVLRKPEVTAAIAGARKPAQIEETARASDLTLPADAVEEIEALLSKRDAAIASART